MLVGQHKAHSSLAELWRQPDSMTEHGLKPSKQFVDYTTLVCRLPGWMERMTMPIAQALCSQLLRLPSWPVACLHGVLCPEQHLPEALQLQRVPQLQKKRKAHCKRQQGLPVLHECELVKLGPCEEALGVR